jgi:hypothetical protein
MIINDKLNNAGHINKVTLTFSGLSVNSLDFSYQALALTDSDGT